jgi:hypothetical protein
MKRATNIKIPVLNNNEDALMLILFACAKKSAPNVAPAINIVNPRSEISIPHRRLSENAKINHNILDLYYSHYYICRAKNFDSAILGQPPRKVYIRLFRMLG